MRPAPSGPLDDASGADAASPGRGTRTCSPSTTTRARLTAARSAPGRAPPALATASPDPRSGAQQHHTRRFTMPTTCTTSCCGPLGTLPAHPARPAHPAHPAACRHVPPSEAGRSARTAGQGRAAPGGDHRAADALRGGAGALAHATRTPPGRRPRPTTTNAMPSAAAAGPLTPRDLQGPRQGSGCAEPGAWPAVPTHAGRRGKRAHRRRGAQRGRPLPRLVPIPRLVRDPAPAPCCRPVLVRACSRSPAFSPSACP